ncbi:MAG: PAS domain-containing protein [Candidatus Margulisbacteria bacterium]|nr:PAS domain-containing protein [Candidatus Margulisiibacteriota bacterium]
MLIDFWYRNMAVVYLLYGLSLFGLGLIILFYGRIVKASSYRLVDILWLLGWFGIVQGVNEMIEMFSFLQGSSFLSEISSSLALFGASLLLFLFGYRLVNLVGENKLRFWFPLLFALLFFGWPALMGVNSYFVWNAASKYFLALPGAILSSIGLLVYSRQQAAGLDDHRDGKYFILAALAFGAYAVFGGLLIPQANFFPASIINSKTFLDLFGVPVQVLRAACAIAIAWSVLRVMDIFDAERIGDALRQKDLLWDAEMKNRNLIENIPIGIIATALDGKILEANPVTRELFGLGEADDIYSFPIISFYSDPQDWARLSNRLAKNEVVKDFRARLKRKDGGVFSGKIYAVRQTIGPEVQIIMALREILACEEESR